MERVTIIPAEKAYDSWIDHKFIPEGKDKYYIRYDGTKLEVFDRIADPELKNDLAESDAKAYQPELNFLKAIIQQYNNRMIENRLTIK